MACGWTHWDIPWDASVPDALMVPPAANGSVDGVVGTAYGSGERSVWGKAISGREAATCLTGCGCHRRISREASE